MTRLSILSLVFSFLMSVYIGLSSNAFAQMVDADGDGHASLATGGDDCDDNDANRYPGNAEVCDDQNHDEDCNCATFGMRDADGDGYPDASCCNECRDTGLNCGNDCDDFIASTHPTANEVCNGIDDDCNGAVDEGVLIDQYVDTDLDGYGDGRFTPAPVCPDTQGFSQFANDCDDNNDAIKPGAMVCSPDDPATVLICDNDGVYRASPCDLGSLCVSQPNGTGFCQAKQFNKIK